MQLGKTIMTNAGIALQNEAVTTAVPIILTTMKIGTGAVATIEEALALTDLVLIYEDTGISKIVNESNIYKVTTTYDNEVNTSEVTITEIGIYAKLGDTGTPVLFAYTNEDPGIVLPIRGTGAVLEIEKTLGVGITELATVNITVSSGIYALQTTQIIAGNGLIGGGDFSSNRTLNIVSATDGIIINPDNIQLNTENTLPSTSPTKVISSNMSKILFENGVGKAVSGYIEDGGSHAVGEVWLSRNNKGEFKCLVANTDNFIDVAKWLQIDDLTNASKLENLGDITLLGEYNFPDGLSVGQNIQVPLTENLGSYNFYSIQIKENATSTYTIQYFYPTSFRPYVAMATDSLVDIIAESSKSYQLDAVCITAAGDTLSFNIYKILNSVAVFDSSNYITVHGIWKK